MTKQLIFQKGPNGNPGPNIKEEEAKNDQIQIRGTNFFCCCKKDQIGRHLQFFFVIS